MKTILNCQTGEITERELNDDELAQQAIDEAAQEVVDTEAEAKATARQAILDRLGITADEAKLLLS